MSRWIVGVLWMSLAVVPLACESDAEAGACTLIGCMDGFSVTFAKAGAWEAGAYTVAVEVDGATTTCSVSLPLADCSVTPTCDTAMANMNVTLSGCALGASEHKLSGVSWNGVTPAKVTVSVAKDGVKLGHGSYEPSYVQRRPNGPGCGPVCKQAQTPTLALN